MKKEINKDKVFQFTGLYLPPDFVKPKFIVDAFKRKILYVITINNEEILMIRNSYANVLSFFKMNEIVNIGDYLIKKDDGSVSLIRNKDFKAQYNIVD